MRSKKLKKLLIATGIVIFFTALNSLVVYLENSYLAINNSEEISTLTFMQPKANNKRYKDTVWLDYEGNVNKYTLTASIHEMTNAIVIADLNARWDAGKITQDKINRVYDTAYALEDTDKDKAGFIAIAERWRKHDFSKAV